MLFVTTQNAIAISDGVHLASDMTGVICTCDGKPIIQFNPRQTHTKDSRFPLDFLRENSESLIVTDENNNVININMLLKNAAEQGQYSYPQSDTSEPNVDRPSMAELLQSAFGGMMPGRNVSVKVLNADEIANLPYEVPEGFGVATIESVVESDEVGESLDTDDDLEEADISMEACRIYQFYGYVPGSDQLQDEINVHIEDPVLLFTRPGGTTHRIVDSNGVVYIVPAPGFFGCTIRYKVKPGYKSVSF